MVIGGNSSMDANVFIGYLVIFSQLIAPSKAFTTAFYNVQKGIASADRIAVMIDAPITIQLGSRCWRSLLRCSRYSRRGVSTAPSEAVWLFNTWQSINFPP